VSDARSQAFTAACLDRKIAVALAGDMLRHATSAPQFKPGLLAAMRAGGTPADAADVLACCFAEKGVQSDADALHALTAVCAQWGLTWAEVGGN